MSKISYANFWQLETAHFSFYSLLQLIITLNWWWVGEIHAKLELLCSVLPLLWRSEFGIVPWKSFELGISFSAIPFFFCNYLNTVENNFYLLAILFLLSTNLTNTILFLSFTIHHCLLLLQSHRPTSPQSSSPSPLYIFTIEVGLAITPLFVVFFHVFGQVHSLFSAPVVGA